MRFHYISPSVLPSKSANSVHVIMQCDALVSLGASVTPHAKRIIPDKSIFMQAVQESYGVDLGKIKLVTYYNNSNFAFLCSAVEDKSIWCARRTLQQTQFDHAAIITRRRRIN